MFKDIPSSLKDKNEDYLIINKLQEFCKENLISTSSIDKVDLTKCIIDFAKINEENSDTVCNWLDETFKEGIKRILIAKIGNIRSLKNKCEEEWLKLIQETFNINKSMSIVNKKHNPNIELCGYNFIKNNEKISIVSLFFSILLKEQKMKGSPYKTIIYPIFIDIYLEKGYIVGRAKSKSSIFKFFNEHDIDENFESTNYEKLIIETFNILYNAFSIIPETIESSMHTFKSAIHLMVEECTETPKVINDRLESELEYRKNFVKEFFRRQSISFIEEDYYKNALRDIEILMEKYLSISSTDKSIFTNDRYAYPVQISATDSDFSSVDESSLEGKPLQCTPIFFDNKKLIQKEKKCDNVAFIFKRQPKTYFPRKDFSVELEVKKGYMYLDFRKYVLEEDIQNVLSRIIRSN